MRPVTIIKHFIARLCAFILRNRRSRVIFYHDIHDESSIKYYECSTSINLFLKHISLLRENGFEVVKEITKPYNQIMITFDDGYKGLYDFRNIIESHKIYIKIFLISSKMKDPNFISIKQLKVLNDSKYYSFGAHTHNHYPLISLDDKQIIFEITESKKIISSIIKDDVDDFAFPIGKFNDNVITKCKQNGFKKLYSAVPGAYYDNDRYIFRSLAQDLTTKQFRSMIYGGYDIFKKYYLSLSLSYQEN